MCRMLYIAADEPPPLIEWIEEAPAFCASALQPREEDVRGRFTKPFVVFLGAHTGCGCGFIYEYDRDFLEDEEDRKEYAEKEESVRRLSAYLERLVEKGGVEMFACWDDERDAEPEERLAVTPAYFSSDSFLFRDKQFFVIDKGE